MSRTPKKAPAPRKRPAGIEEALRVSEDRLRRVVTNIPVVLWEVDSDGVFTLSEGKGLKALGLAPGEVLGKSVYDVYAASSIICETIREALESGEEAHYVVELERVFDNRISPTFDSKHKVTGLIGVSIDITERTEAERALRGLSRRLWAIQEEERRRVARELHDDAGQAAMALKLKLDLARREANPAKIRARIEEAIALSSQVLDELRRITYELRPGALDELGLVPAIRALVESFRQRTAVKVEFAAPEKAHPRMELDCEAAIFRFAQEALANVERHARAQRVRLAVEFANARVRVMVEDDGAGFDARRPPARGKVGLLGMEERARMLGGELVVESRPGEGTRIRLDVPFLPLV